MNTAILMSLISIGSPTNARIWMDFTRADAAKAVASLVGDYWFFSERTTIQNVPQTFQPGVRQAPGLEPALDHQIGMSVYLGYTNLWEYSSDRNQWGAFNFGAAALPVYTDAVAEAPDGNMTLDRIQFDLNGGVTLGDAAAIYYPVDTGVPSVAPATIGFWAKSNDVNTYSLVAGDDGALAGSLVAFDVTPELEYHEVTYDSTTGNRAVFIALQGGVTSDTADILIWVDTTSEHKAGITVTDRMSTGPFVYTNGAPASSEAELCGSNVTDASIDSDHGLVVTSGTDIDLTGTKYDGTGLDTYIIFTSPVDVWSGAIYEKATMLKVATLTPIDAQTVTMSSAITLGGDHLIVFPDGRIEEVVAWRSSIEPMKEFSTPLVNDYTILLEGWFIDLDPDNIKDTILFYGFRDVDNAVIAMITNRDTFVIKHLVNAVEKTLTFPLSTPIMPGGTFSMTFVKRSSGLSEATFNGDSGTRSLPEDTQTSTVVAYLVAANLGCADSEVSGNMSIFKVTENV